MADAAAMSRLRELLLKVCDANLFQRRRFEAAGLSREDLRQLDGLERLPFTSKQELLDDQAAHPPYGTNLTYPAAGYARLHQTSGSRGQPLRCLDASGDWNWMLELWSKIYAVVGVTEQDRFFFPFSFGPFLGFWAAFEGATRLGRFCVAGGGMTSNARLRLILDNSITIIGCTPTYAMRLAEAAAEEALDLSRGSAVRLLILAGEPGASIPEVRQRLEAAWGARVIDHWGMTEVGSLGVECLENPGGFHLLADDCIPEVIDPATGRQAAPGAEGELVITNLGRLGFPAIRYRTGDRVAFDPQPCPCGRPWPRLKGGVLGRTDDLLFIRGNNVYPAMIEAVVRRFPEVAEFQMVAQGAELTLRLEPRPGLEAGLAERVAAAVRDAYHFRPEIELAAPNSLPRPEMKSNRLVRKG